MCQRMEVKTVALERDCVYVLEPHRRTVLVLVRIADYRTRVQTSTAIHNVPSPAHLNIVYSGWAYLRPTFCN